MKLGNRGIALAQVILLSLVVAGAAALLPSLLRRSTQVGRQTEIKNAVLVFKKNLEQMLLYNPKAWANTVMQNSPPSPLVTGQANLNCIATAPAQASDCRIGNWPAHLWVVTGGASTAPITASADTFYNSAYSGSSVLDSAYKLVEGKGRASGLTRSGAACGGVAPTDPGNFSQVGSFNWTANRGNAGCPLRANVFIRPLVRPPSGLEAGSQCWDYRSPASPPAVLVPQCKCPYWVIDVRFSINSPEASDSAIRVSNYDFQLVRSSSGAPGCP